MSYKAKIENILHEQGITAAQLAEYLGITARTLSDFIREDREPGGAVARLLDLMSGERTTWSDQLLKNRLLFVAVHREFVLQVNQDPDAVVDVTEEVSRYAEMSVTYSADEKFRFSSEMHYVDFSPSSEREWSAVEKLKSRNIKPSFLWGFSSEDKFAKERLDCHFSATTMWQISKHSAGTLSDIVIAANFDKFWPLARYIKETMESNVIFAFHNESDITENIKDRLDRCSIRWISLGGTGRKVGKIRTKLPGYGYIDTDDGKLTFYHWNSMHKKENGEPEFLFEQIPEGSRVSFILDQNHKGPCAVDVKLIELSDGTMIDLPKQPSLDTPAFKLKRNEKLSEAMLHAAIKDAIESCAGENGYANNADVGNRVKIKLGSSIQEILRILGYSPESKLIDFVSKYPQDFETMDDGNSTTGRHRWISLKH